MKKALFFAIALLALSCTEPIDLKFPQTGDKVIVVDGALTDSLKSHLVRVHYTSGFDGQGRFIPDPVTNAVVLIVDDLGNEFPLSQERAGHYKTQVMRAETDRQYGIRVNLEGSSYESEFQGLPEGRGELELTYEPEQREELSTSGQLREFNAVRIDANLTNVATGSYFLWELEHHFIGEAFISNTYCHVRDFDIPQVDLYNVSANNIPQEQVFTHEVDLIEPSYKFKHDYAVVAKQFIVSPEAHEYWRKIKEQINNVGSLFDSAPARIFGNIKNRETDQLTLGYFGVYKESVSRTFFNQNELPFPVVDYECLASPPPEFCTNCLAHPGLEKLPLYVEERLWWRCIAVGTDDHLLNPPLTQTIENCN